MKLIKNLYALNKNAKKWHEFLAANPDLIPTLAVMYLHLAINSNLITKLNRYQEYINNNIKDIDINFGINNELKEQCKEILDKVREERDYCAGVFWDRALNCNKKYLNSQVILSYATRYFNDSETRDKTDKKPVINIVANRGAVFIPDKVANNGHKS